MKQILAEATCMVRVTEREFVTTAAINIRETPNGAVITSIAEGTRVRTVTPIDERWGLGSSGTWIHIYYDGTNTGWVAKAYLKEAETAPPLEYVSFEREEYLVEAGKSIEVKMRTTPLYDKLEKTEQTVIWRPEDNSPTRIRFPIWGGRLTNEIAIQLREKSVQWNIIGGKLYVDGVDLGLEPMNWEDRKKNYNEAMGIFL